MKFNPEVIPFLILIAGALAMFLPIHLLSKEMSRERLANVERLDRLWKGRFPPREVLTDRGRDILKWSRFFILALVLVATAVGLLITGFSMSPIVATGA